jgi:hypothetical protein
MVIILHLTKTADTALFTEFLQDEKFLFNLNYKFQYHVNIIWTSGERIFKV